MSLFRDDGIVLRTRKPGEADRIMLRDCGGHGVRLPLRGGPHPQPKIRGGAR
ncbi:hypothetical protein ACFY1U_00960 [Streptomyces sp. NPDC001351]|uniref:hypothetical protein n=1 Tax=Streptomyces sp. NPDC001351 TaxID=3364564 RepID=UPI0036B06F95